MDSNIATITFHLKSQILLHYTSTSDGNHNIINFKSIRVSERDIVDKIRVNAFELGEH